MLLGRILLGPEVIVLNRPDQPADHWMVVTLRSRFDDAWVPRLGVEAAAQLRRLAVCAFALGPVVIVLSVAGSLGINSGRAIDTALGALAILVVVGLCAGWVSLSVRFAAAISRWFGEDIGWRELPRFRPSLFDQWCHQRNLKPTSSG